MVWFTLGLLVSAVNMRSIRRFVTTLVPGTKLTQRRITIDYLLRYALNAILLLVAIQFGIRAALAAFAGLWVYRWVFVWIQNDTSRRKSGTVAP